MSLSCLPQCSVRLFLQVGVGQCSRSRSTRQRAVNNGGFFFASTASNQHTVTLDKITNVIGCL